MQEPLFDIFGTKRREPTVLNQQISLNLKGNSVLDLKAGGAKSTQKKALVDVKNRLLAFAPVTDNRAGVLKPSTLSTPAFNKTKTTPLRSPVLKSTVGKKVTSKSDSSAPFFFVEQTSKTRVFEDECEIPDVVADMDSMSFEEDDYEDLMPKSERFTNEQIHKLVNYWELTRPPASSNSPPKEPVPLDVSAPELEVPDLNMITVPAIKMQPVPLPSFQIWHDDME